MLRDRSRLGRSGFSAGSDLYERTRPGYSDESVAHLVAAVGISAGRSVLDVAAGTGKLTRALTATGATCFAAEPSASMRAVFATTVPGVPMVASTAEQLPFTSRTMDAVVVAQAFHWFDAPVALAEFSRVLRPGGGLALVWNERDESDPVVARTRPHLQVGHPPALPGGSGLRAGHRCQRPVRTRCPDPLPVQPGAGSGGIRRSDRNPELRRRPARGPAPGPPGRGGRVRRDAAGADRAALHR